MARFFDLPAELRNAIYYLALTHDATIEIRHRHMIELCPGKVRAMAQVSQQCRSECFPVYYSANIFLLSSMEDCLTWLKVVGPACADIQHLKLRSGVLEGIPWANKSTRRYHRRHSISIRLSVSGTSDRGVTELTTGGEIHDDVKEVAMDVAKDVRDMVRQFGVYDLTVSCRVYHCAHCALGGCRVCFRAQCCRKKT